MRRTMIIAALSILALTAAAPRRHQTVDAATSNVAQCQYVVTPLAQSFAVRGGVGSLSVLAASNCAWMAASNTPWINITSANTGSGLGRVNYSVAANPNANQRTGVITVAGLNVIVTQAGTGSASCTVTPINAGQPINGSLAPGDCQSPLRIKDGARPFADRAPSQINYQIPPGTASGAATMTVTSGDGTISTGTANIAPVAPGLFSANASGQGVAAATVLRFKADGSQTFESVATFDQARNQFVAAPIDLGPDLGNASDQLFLILSGTGARFGSSLAAATCLIGA